MSPEQMWPAEEPDVRVRTVPVEGVRLRVVESGPAGAPPVLLVHGWAASAYSWRHTFRRLRDRWRVVGFDLPGHGLSEKPLKGAAYTDGALLGCVRGVMDALELGSAAVVGQSLGGRLALELARTTPERVTRVYAINPIGMGAVTGLMVGRLLSASPLSPVRRPLAVPRWFVRVTLSFVYGTAGGYDDRDVDEYWAPSQFPEYAAALAHMLLRASWQTVETDRWSGLAMPVRVAHGGKDRLVRTDVGKLRARIPAGSPIDIVEGGGHILQEEAPVAVHEWLRAFLAEAN